MRRRDLVGDVEAQTQALAKTTGLYDRQSDDISVSEVERVGI